MTHRSATSPARVRSCARAPRASSASARRGIPVSHPLPAELKAEGAETRRHERRAPIEWARSVARPRAPQAPRGSGCPPIARAVASGLAGPGGARAEVGVLCDGSCPVSWCGAPPKGGQRRCAEQLRMRTAWAPMTCARRRRMIVSGEEEIIGRLALLSESDPPRARTAIRIARNAPGGHL